MASEPSAGVQDVCTACSCLIEYPNEPISSYCGTFCEACFLGYHIFECDICAGDWEG